MPVDAVVLGLAVVLGTTSLGALLAVQARGTDEPGDAAGRGGAPTLSAWALADRSHGGVMVWLLLGGTIYTAYTYAAVPGLVYGAGAVGFFALPYTVVVYCLAFWMLPRLHAVSVEHGYLTVADYARGRWGSHLLALVVALTGLLATMPYVALQLLGIRSVLEVGGVYPEGLRGDAVLVLVFAVLAVATYRSGLHAPALIAVVKGVLVVAVAVGVSVAVLSDTGGLGPVFTGGDAGSGAGAAPLGPHLHMAYATLALGSAMALLVYPHVLTAAFSARTPSTLRRAEVAMPAWTAVLAVFGLLGLAARSLGIEAPPGRAEAALPLLVAELLPALATGLVFGALAVGALVPAAVMSVAAGALFARNIYGEYLHPEATPRTQTRVARLTSLLVKAGAVGFVFGLRGQDAISLQLLGGVWILQTFPAVALGLCTRRLHHGGVLAGWAVGMLIGTWLVARGGFSALVRVDLLGWETQVYAAVLALAANLVVAVALSPLLDRWRVPRGIDATAVSEPGRALGSAT